MPRSTTTTLNVAGSTSVTIERLDDPQRKIRAEHQLQSLRKLSYWGIVGLLVNTVYFAYRVKCSLDARFDIPFSDVIIAWIWLGLEISLACE